MTKTNTQAVSEDLPKGTFVVLSDKPGSICRVMKTTPNGIVFMEYGGWRASARIFRYRHAIQEMSILSAKQVCHFIIRSFDYSMLDQKENMRRAPNEQKLRGFVARWGMDWLVYYLSVCGGFQTQPRGRLGYHQRTEASLRHFTKVVTESKYRRLLAAKARCPAVRLAFGAQAPRSLALH